MQSPNKTPSATAFLGLGSNISPRVINLEKAIQGLQLLFPSNFSISSYYHTKPYKDLQQKSYVNCCVSFNSSEPAQKLLHQTQSLERKIGRVRSYNTWESRKIDIDILLYGDNIHRFRDLIIPHYDLSKRDFFLIPLIELDKHLINPSSGKSLVMELGNLSAQERTVVKKFNSTLL
ncbi:MAG: 2-amino-4-hydroxy-6-hydroxymethyldihydropteridine diphosphokinase [Proteobacteria bacterium]|nr:2-amino-4-hydroxy-6-hydroxymethyldihydropteridine diphosphokinase [Pseudomonadota bacterium]